MSGRPPHIVYVLADDMGFGDLACNDPAAKIPTPHLDRLASRGMRMTDMHATSAVCTPSRYSLLTGRYAWRTPLKSGIVWPWDAPLIDEEQPTVAAFLQDNGYRTACIGKWHLGWDWPTKDGTHPNDTLEFGTYCDDERAEYEDNIDYAQPVAGGPVDRGFDSYFGVDVPNFTPYSWFVDDRVTEAPTVPKPDDLYGHPGRAVPGWSHEAMIPAFTQRAVSLIEETGSDSDGPPLFLYYALTSPHSPVVPNDEFKGASGIGNYGDFVCEVDWLVGELVDALERAGLFDNTLFIFTSDNGPERQVGDDEGVFERARRTRHFSMGPWRGAKVDVWEAGHRVPFIATWPEVIPEAAVSHDMVSLVDFMATCAEILDRPLPHGASEDGVSMLAQLRGEEAPDRAPLVLHGGDGRLALRDGDWMFIDAPSGGVWPEPEWYREEQGYVPHDLPGELFNLADDPTERTNLYADKPEVVERMTATLERLRQ
jgi:arylsulfatase A